MLTELDYKKRKWEKLNRTGKVEVTRSSPNKHFSISRINYTHEQERPKR